MAMPRPLAEIIFHLRSVSANPAVATTLIQTEDLLALCDAAEKRDPEGKPLLERLREAGCSEEPMPSHIRDLLFQAAMTLSAVRAGGENG